MVGVKMVMIVKIWIKHILYILYILYSHGITQDIDGPFSSNYEHLIIQFSDCIDVKTHLGWK